MCLDRFRIPAIVLPLLAITSAATAADDKTAEICAKAEERYVDIYGHPSSEEDGVTVVTMYKYKFCPPKLTVPIGTTVRWVNVDKRTSHTVHLNETGVAESERMFPEENFEYTFVTAGAQQYLCGPHWESHDMIGMVTVEQP